MKIFIALSILAISCFSCLKTKNSDDPYIAKINFTCNSQPYQTSSVSSYLKTQFYILLSANFAGLKINRPDIFGGVIEIDCDIQGNILCAYLNPTGMNVSGACNNLLNNGAPIDSVKVFWYESGSVNFGWSDCKNIPNGYQGEQDCAINGSFNITLTNKNNQKIILSNGSFSGRIKRYQ